LVLFGFAVAQPLFSVLSGYPEFFVARQSQPLDLILLALILCLGLPSLLILLEAVVRTVAPRLYPYAHVVLVWILTTAIVLQVLKNVGTVPATALGGAAVLLAMTASVAYLRLETVRTYVTVLSPAVLLFPGLFFLNSGIYKVAFPEQAEVRSGDVEATAPVVMVVLDEFPLSSIMDENRRIDPIRFPNLARFAEGSHWFRNATTVSDNTLVSVPAMLSGLRPRLHDPRLPTMADYPDNLFTLLSDSYELNVFEHDTQLSPGTEAQQAVWQRMSSVLSDLATVYAHLLLPSDLASSLPAVDQSWGDFGSVVPSPGEMKTLGDFLYVSDTDNRVAKFKEFIDSIQLDDRPPLFFLHAMLPHSPWKYLPNGKRYSVLRSLPGLSEADRGDGLFPAWGADRSLMIQGYQRHLLQAGFVDALLGDLIDKLKQVGLYDPSLIVITADHGVSFRAADFWRRVSETNYPDIMWIPLLVKTPHQAEGAVTDRNVETIDILPTIADALGIELPFETEGRSALDHTSAERAKKTMFAGTTREFVFEPRVDFLDESLRRKLELFGSGPWDSLFAYGAYADLAGNLVHDIGVSEAGMEVELEGEAFFEKVDFDSPLLLTNITGHISAGPNDYPSRHLAVAVNGRVQSVTELSTRFHNTGDFTALVPETAFVPGKNDVEVFLVVEVDGRPRLERLSKGSRAYYALIGSATTQAETLQTPDGTSVSVVPGNVDGRVRSAMFNESETVVISGWAVDVKQPALGMTILVFQNRELVYSGTPRAERPDVAGAHPEWGSLTPGFRFELPLAKFESLDHEVRVFALSQGGTASELSYLRDGWVFAFSSPATD
jgi:hypothetical protein